MKIWDAAGSSGLVVPSTSFRLMFICGQRTSLNEISSHLCLRHLAP